MVFTATACFGRDETDNLVQEQTQEVIDVPRILPLSECVEIALKYNPFLQSAHLNKEVAAYDRKIVQGRQWPSLHAKGGANLFLDDQRLISSRYNGEEGVFGQDIEEIGVVLRMPLFTGGQIVNSIRAVALNQSAVDNQFSRSRQELIFNVTSAFYTILGRQKQLESIRFSRNVLNKNKNRINALISAKKAAQVDLLRIDVRLARIEQNWVNINNDLHIAWRVLYKLMGVQTDFEKELSNLDGKLMPIPLMPDTREAFNCALSNRPDFKALINKVDAQKSRLRATRGKRLPQIYLEGSYGYRYMTDPSDQPDGHDALEDRGAMGLALDIPIFEGGSIQAEINRETVMVSVLEQELRFLTLQIQKEVETAIFNMQSTWQRVKTQEAAIAQAREALRIEQEKYGLGKGTILDVLDAQNAMLEIETDYYRAASEYHIANAQFDLIKGEAK
jgi:outer membrane protein TolC